MQLASPAPSAPLETRPGSRHRESVCRLAGAEYLQPELERLEQLFLDRACHWNSGSLLRSGMVSLGASSGGGPGKRASKLCIHTRIIRTKCSRGAGSRTLRACQMPTPAPPSPSRRVSGVAMPPIALRQARPVLGLWRCGSLDLDSRLSCARVIKLAPLVVHRVLLRRDRVVGALVRGLGAHSALAWPSAERSVCVCPLRQSVF